MYRVELRRFATRVNRTVGGGDAATTRMEHAHGSPRKFIIDALPLPRCRLCEQCGKLGEKRRTVKCRCNTESEQRYGGTQQLSTVCRGVANEARAVAEKAGTGTVSRTVAWAGDGRQCGADDDAGGC